jgi:hypothetical protein
MTNPVPITMTFGAEQVPVRTPPARVWPHVHI